GLALRLTIPWYRSLWLSSVTSLDLSVDGERVDADDLRFGLGDRRYRLDELPEQSETLWFLQQHPLLVARRVEPVSLGE
ncbi:C-glycoside deglycosidase beta subunit domain-containing protein, partial [Staphylococcus aureus]